MIRLFSWLTLACSTLAILPFRSGSNQPYILSGEYNEFLPEAGDLMTKPTPEEMLCMSVRRSLYSLPSYNPPEYSLTSIFKKAKKGMNSFRMVGVRLVESFWEYNEMKSDEDFLVKLEALKRVYYEKYRKTVTTKNGALKEELEQAEKSREDALTKQAKLNAQIEELQEGIKGMYVALDKMVSNGQLKTKVENVTQKYRLATGFLAEVDTFYQLDPGSKDFILFQIYVVSLAEQKSKKDYKTWTDKMRSYHQILLKLGDVRARILGLMYMYNNQEVVGFGMKMAALSFMEIYQKKLDKIEGEIKVFGDKLKNWGDKVRGLIQKHLNSQWKKLKTDKDYSEYLDLIKKVVKKTRKMREKVEEKNVQDTRLEVLNNLLSDNDDVDKEIQNMVIPRNLKALIRAEIEEIKDFLSSDRLSKRSDELELKWELDYDLINSKNADGLDVFGRLKELREQLNLLLLIEQYEKRVDGFIGHVFRILTSKMGGYKCFNLGDLSYTIFSMIKTNIVLHQRSFFNSFFNGMRPADVTKFVVFNYKVFMNEEFMANLTQQMRHKAGTNYAGHFYSSLKDQYVDTFIRMMNLFKELTVYRSDDLHAVQKKVGFWERIWQALLDNYDIAWNVSKSGLKFILVKHVIENMLKVVPILGNILWLRALLAKAMAAKLLKLIEDHIDEFKVGVVELYEQAVRLFDEEDFLGEDWASYVNQQVDKPVKE